MSIRAISPRSERGSIKDIKAATEEVQESPYNLTIKPLEPSQFELRQMKLFEYAKSTNDDNLLAASGFITTDYISDKNALPLSIYRLRKIVADIKARRPERIDSFAAQLSEIFDKELSSEAMQYLEAKRVIKKLASATRMPIFRRVNK